MAVVTSNSRRQGEVYSVAGIFAPSPLLTQGIGARRVEPVQVVILWVHFLGSRAHLSGMSG